ncbi:hypothetical protein EFD62_14710 [Acetivibrio mesophilus]|uniref:Glycosyltransferase RgtA/B/C/D-like domain-containing protein n=2 Tax=Acetivibrio mesophilus TaxID=2487273 RepID=A0A4V1K1T9_9FIRM|nr:hypothetical protein EFD62_14710 [Acetivibrio mesophilus]
MCGDEKMKFKPVLLLYTLFISVVRLVIFFTSDPIMCPDTESYIELANMIAKLDFSNFDGLRTPGYPFIILLSGLNLKIVVLIQMIMGITISYLIANIIYKFTNNTMISLLASCLYSLFIPFLFFEMAILSETTAAFFIILSFALFTNINTNKNHVFLKIISVIVLSCIAGLTRPIYFVLPFLYTVYFLFALWKEKYKLPKIILYSFISLIPLAISVVSWSYVNLKYNNTFSIATGRGFAFMEMAGDYIELAPNDYPYNVIKEVYIRERDKNIREGTPHIDTIWAITDELQEKTGLNYEELSKKVKDMCIKVMLKKPDVYFRAVLRSEVNFWKTFGILIRTETGVPMPVRFINILQRSILILLQLPFLVAPLVFFITRRQTGKKISNNILLVFSLVYILVIGVSILIALVEGGEGRFAMPTFPLLIVVTFILYNSVFQGNFIPKKMN